MKICNRCILPESFPGISFDADGVCNYCHRDESALRKSPARKQEYRKRLDQLIADVKGRAPLYDAIMAYSGGKDSSYTLNILREHYGLRAVAFTFDNHFVSPFAWQNIKNVTETLSVDLIAFRPAWGLAKDVFRLTAKEDIFAPPTLLRASSICTACIGMVKSLVLKTALEQQIPLVVFGWSPGQAPIQSAIMKTNPQLIRQNQASFKKAFPQGLDERVDRMMIPESYYEIYKDRFPHNIHPLAFFDYDEDKIVEKLSHLGWRAPTDTDTNSTNCLLNAYANQCHLERHGFHPYVWEIANMVRSGVIDRAEGLDKIYSPQDPDMIELAKGRLGV